MVTNRLGTEEKRTNEQTRSNLMSKQIRPGRLNKTEQTRDAFTISPVII